MGFASVGGVVVVVGWVAVTALLWQRRRRWDLNALDVGTLSVLVLVGLVFVTLAVGL